MMLSNYPLTVILLTALLAVAGMGCGGDEPAMDTPEAETTPDTAAPPPEAAASAAPHEQTGLAVGVATAAINPAPGVWLGGYGHDRAATGNHDDLFAKGIVFHDGKTAVGLVVLDALSIQYPTGRAIRTKAAREVTAVPLPAERIVVQATHTHAAPDTIGIYGPSPTESGVTPEYMAALEEAAVSVLAEAAENLQPAALYWTTTEGPAWAVNDSEPGVVDREITVLQAVAPDSGPIATLTHFACHPTVLDGNNTRTSADWVGTFYARMAEAAPGAHLYLQGAIGAWIQPQTPERTFELAARYGAGLAERTLAALENIKPVKGSQVRAAHKTFRIPAETERFQQLAASGLVDREFAGEGMNTEVTWFAVGNAQFATHPAETAPLYSWETELLMDTEPKFVLGLAQDHLGYFNPPKFYEEIEAYPHAAYLTQMSPGKHAGPAMMRMLAAIIP